eukprot:4261394-Heterocapsa_arctica.AAC.1
MITSNREDTSVIPHCSHSAPGFTENFSMFNSSMSTEPSRRTGASELDREIAARHARQRRIAS